MYERFLPIGTVVVLKNSEKKLVITTYLPITNEKTMFDYGSCTFPEGVIETSVGTTFNHEDIKEVVHMGLVNDEQKEFNQVLKTNADKLKQKYSEEMNKNE